MGDSASQGGCSIYIGWTLTLSQRALCYTNKQTNRMTSRGGYLIAFHVIRLLD